MCTTMRSVRLPALMLLALLLGLPATEAAAGCLSDYSACADCARSALWKAMKKLSLSGIRDADIQLADCGIDLWHCMLFDNHHSYPVRCLILLVAAACALVAPGCGGPPVPAEWTLELEEIGRVGDGSDPAEAFYEPVAIRVDGAGRLFVLDAGNNRVQVFDAAGQHVGTRGRTGEGPGDLSRPTGMWVFPDGELVVADAGNARIARFGAGGDPLPSAPLDFIPLDVVGNPRYLYVLRLPPPTFVYGPGREPLIYRTDRDGHILDGFVEPEEAEVGILYFLRNTLRIAPAARGGVAVANTHVVSRIRDFDADGTPRGSVDVLYKAQGLAPVGRLPSSINEASLERIARTCTAIEWDARRGLYWVVAGYVDRRRDGRWVVGNELYRYRPTGQYAGSIPLPYSARSFAAAPDGSVWVLDAEGVVHHLRVTDPEMTPGTDG